MTLVFEYKKVILDLRNNIGGITPIKLLTYLIGSHSFPTMGYSSNLNVSVLESYHAIYERFKNELSAPSHLMEALRLSSLGANPKLVVQLQDNAELIPNSNPYVICLTNNNTYSAAEDFVYALKKSQRATIVGQPTNGSTGQTFIRDVGDDFILMVPCKLVYLVNQIPFEGVGIEPDILVEHDLDALEKGQDVVIDKAIELFPR